MTSPKAHRAAERRWRFVGVRTKGGEQETYFVGLANRTEARAFAHWIVQSGAAKSADLRDENGNDGGEGWASVMT